MTIGSILGKSFFGNVFLFGVSVLMLEYYYEVFLIKYNFGVFDEMSIMEFLMKYNYGVSDKIIPTMNKIIKAIKYNVNIAMC